LLYRKNQFIFGVLYSEGKNMSEQIIAVIVGAVIGSLSSLVTALSLSNLSNRRRRKSIQAIAAAEVTTIMEKAQRYIDEQSDKEELSASTPMLISIASEIGLLTPKQVIAFRRTITLDMEMRKTGNKEKAQMAISACKEALNVIGK
jgi:gas vesicle protein